MRIGIVAGEASGDILASRLMAAIKKRIPNATFVGIAGPLMQAEGCETLFPSEKLSVMGLTEVLKHLPEILSIRRHVARHFLAQPPDVFIGVDAPDFNITLERWLRAASIKTVHYVSPSVWAWRQYRIKKIAKAVDLMLTLFPFEADFYRRFSVPVKFVGHPLADEIPLQSDKFSARRQLGIAEQGRYVALLPGSRMGEVTRLAGPMLDAAALCLQQRPDLKFIVPFASNKTRHFFEAITGDRLPSQALTLFDGQSRTVMAAADAILLASGTAALEAMLVNRPMVVTYRVSALSYRLMRALSNLGNVSLPNILAGREVVQELIQNDATADKMSAALVSILNDDRRSTETLFTQIHRDLSRHASEAAADAVVELMRTGVASPEHAPGVGHKR